MQTHLNTLVILQLLPQLQVELWVTKEAIDEKHGPSFLMTKAVLIGIGVPFPQNLDGLQIQSTLSPLPNSQCCQSLSQQANDVPFDSAFLCVLLPARVLTGRLPGLETAAVGMVLPTETVFSPSFTLVPRFSVQNSQVNFSGRLDH